MPELQFIAVTFSPYPNPPPNPVAGYANISAKDLMSSEFRVFTQRATLNSLRQMVRQLRDPARVLPLVDDEGRVSGRQGRWEVRSTGEG